MFYEAFGPPPHRGPGSILRVAPAASGPISLIELSSVDSASSIPAWCLTALLDALHR